MKSGARKNTLHNSFTHGNSFHGTAVTLDRVSDTTHKFMVTLTPVDEQSYTYMPKGNNESVTGSQERQGDKMYENAINIQDADVTWADEDEYDSKGIGVVILPNGWIHTPETDNYYPPSEVKEISRNTVTEKEGGE